MRLRVVRCEKCGGSVQFRQGMSSAQCGQCGVALRLDDVLAEEKSLAARPKFKNSTPVKLGMRGRFKNQEYEVIGRLVMGMVEEGETYYWNEWELVAADGDCLFLEFDEGQWKLMETFVPQKPLGPNEVATCRLGSSINLDGAAARVSQIDKAKVHCVEGELTFSAKVGDSARYLDAKSSKNIYAVEWKEDEIEFYRGRLLTERQVLEAFGLKELLAAKDRADRKRRDQNLFASASLVLAVLAFVGWALPFGYVPDYFLYYGIPVLLLAVVFFFIANSKYGCGCLLAVLFLFGIIMGILDEMD